MNTKKYIVGAGVVATMLVGITSLAFANVTITPGDNVAPTDNVIKTPAMEKTAAKAQEIQIGPRGEVLLRGTISAVGAGSLTVKSWGGEWTVNVSTATQLMPSTDMSQFAVGDFVGVQGAMNTTGLWTVDAKLVRNWTARAVVKENKEIKRPEGTKPMPEIKKNDSSSAQVQQQINSILEQIKKIQEQMSAK